METPRSPIGPHQTEGQGLKQAVQKVSWEQKKYASIYKTQCFLIFGVFLEPRNHNTDFRNAYFHLTLTSYPDLSRKILK